VLHFFTLDKSTRIIYFSRDLLPQSNDYLKAYYKNVASAVLVNNALSNGAVTRALRVEKTRFPSSAITTQNDMFTTQFVEEPLNFKDYEFFVGIGKCYCQNCVHN
jgi:hypothetical protein